MAVKLSTYYLFKEMINTNKDIHLLTDEDVRAVQKVLLTIMDDIHIACEKYNINYALSGGCALGAERHKGFIPWDDDMDICMMRKDYDRFRDCMIELYGDKYYIQEVRACENYDLNFMKVRLNGSVFCEFLDPEMEKAGVFVDIFPVENVYDNKLALAVQMFLSDGMQFVCSCLRIAAKKERLLKMAGDNENARKSILLKSRIALPFRIFSFRRWLLWTEKVLMMNKNEDTKIVAIPTGGQHFKGERLPREWMFPPVRAAFEDRSYYVMRKNKKYLKKTFGNYMELPPEEKREHHALLKFELPKE